MNRAEATRLVAVLAAAYPMTQMQEHTAYAYHLGLSDILYADAERAVAMLMRTSKFMPTVAEIREALVEADSTIQGWEAAWDELMTTVKRYGSYLFKPQFQTDHSRAWPGWSDELVAGAVKHVGYENVCMSQLDDLPTIRAQFRNYYENEARRRKKAIQTGDAALPSGTGNIRELKPGEVA